MSSLSYPPEAYNAHGMLRLPVGFYLVLLWQGRTWLVFLLAGASGQQGSDLLRLFYPDTTLFWWGIILGTPAWITLLLAPRRHQWLSLWYYWRWGLMAVTLLLLIVHFWVDPFFDPLSSAGVLITEMITLIYVGYNRRVRACFSEPPF